MATFGRIFKKRKNIIQEFYALVDDAEENREIEEKAAIKIQKMWRGTFARKQLAYYNEKAIIIQKVWRMYYCKLCVRILREQKTSNERKAFYDQKATIIQRTWRGFFTRSQVFDYYKQQRFLVEQAFKNAEMAQMLENYNAETNDYMEDRIYQQNLKYQENFANKNHHLVSTQAISSVFTANALKQENEPLPAIEKYIRSFNKARLVIPSLSSK